MTTDVLERVAWIHIYVESVLKEKKHTFDFHGKIPHVLNSKNDNKHQKQSNSSSKEENSDSLSNFGDVEQSLDDEITIKEEWDVFDKSNK